ncbi:MAG: archaeal proteasome endopeptidase complex subunit alpha [Candidatus Hodarchaeota archaeon]
MFGTRDAGYDVAATIFSPDGRLFQVEYAIEAVRRGTPAVGVKTSDSVILAVEKRSILPLIDPQTVQKIFKIDDHCFLAIAGLTADARILVDQLRIQAQIHRLTYDDTATIEWLTRRICNLKQQYTQFGGVRPFGVSLLIGGIDATGTNLFVTEPSGSFWGHRAAAIGSGSPSIMEFLERDYSPSLSDNETALLAIRALKQASDLDEFDPQNLQIARMTKKKPAIHFLDTKEVSSLIKNL